ncbi:MAG: Hsp20 family protein [Actinophytocola sp.]|nr:Hsp20 family protein [Actinophytocola sp.]
MAIRRRKHESRNPFRGVVDTVSELNRIADRMTGVDGATITPQQPRGHSDAWSPFTDILAKGSDILIRCELPGVDPDAVDVSLSRGTLTIAGSRAEGDEHEDYLVQERTYGQFRRDVTLPEGVQEDEIEASFREGVLEVAVRGAAEASGPARIAVRAAEE